MQSAQFSLHADIEQRHWWFLARRQILAQLVGQLVPASPESLIVDVGCGTGANLAGFAGRYRCLGIDTSAQAIELAQERFPAVRFVHGFAPQAIAAELATARLVMLNDVLEHVPDDFWLLSQVLGAMAPGAHLLVTVPADLALWSAHDESFGHYRRYDRQRFEQAWQGLAAEPLLVSHFNARLFPLVKLVRAYGRSRGKSHGQAGTDFRPPSPIANRMLQRIFAGEANRLVRMLHGRALPYRRGVSLLAVLRRLPGPIQPRMKPAGLQADRFDPALFAAAADSPALVAV